MAIQVFSDTDVLTALASRLAVVLTDAPGPVMFLYSGGSSLSVLNRLSTSITDEDLSHVVFAPVDERRMVSQSNSRAFEESVGYSHFVHAGATFITLGELTDSLDVIADRYDRQIRTLITDIHLHEGVVVQLLGMGIDGHTAGIFPYPEDVDFFNTTFVHTERFVVGYDAGSKNEYSERITLTVPAFLCSDRTFVYVAGISKQETLQRALLPGPVAEIPSRIWQSLPLVEIFTDCQI